MNLILNEEKFIKNIIDTKSVPKDCPKIYLIILLSKYFKTDTDDENTLSDKVKQQMLLFDFDVVEYQEYKWSKKILSVCKKVIEDSLYLKKLSSVPLFRSELDTISSLKTDKEKKVLFVMYIIARFMNCEGWINLSIKDIFKIANISTTIDNQDELLRGFINSGIVIVSKKNDNLNMKVTLSDVDEDIVYNVTNFEKLGNQYIGNFKDGYKQCELCGKPIKVKGTNDKYCKACKCQKQLQWQKESMQRMRNEKCEVSLKA